MADARNDRDDTRTRGSGSTRLHALKDLGSGFGVAEGEPDIRGWEVMSTDGRKLGEVDDLVIDFAALKVRYLSVALDRHIFRLEAARRVLLPIGLATLDEARDDVIIPTGVDFAMLPPYDRDMLRDECALHMHYSVPWQAATGTGAPARTTTVQDGDDDDPMYREREFDEDRLFQARRADRQDRAYLRRRADEEVHLPRVSEELTIRKRITEGEEVIERDLHRRRFDGDTSADRDQRPRRDIDDERRR